MIKTVVLKFVLLLTVIALANIYMGCMVREESSEYRARIQQLEETQQKLIQNSGKGKFLGYKVEWVNEKPKFIPVYEEAKD